MEKLLSNLNTAYGAHQTAWAALNETVRNGQKPTDEIVDQLATTEEQEQACLRELLPPNTEIYVRTGSLYSAPDSIYPSRSIDEQVITIHEVSMQLSPQLQHRDIVRSPFALTSPESSEGIWLNRSPEYYILDSGLRITFGGLRYEMHRLSATHQERMAKLYVIAKMPTNTN